MSDQHTIKAARAEDGFDPSEPNAVSIWGFTVGSIVILALVLVALQGYFYKIWGDAEQEKILSAPDSRLQTVRGRDDWDLTHYMYLDKKTGQVRIPVDRATDLFLQETAAGKSFYPGKPTVPKKEEPAAAAPASGTAGAPTAAAMPAAAADAKKEEVKKQDKKK